MVGTDGPTEVSPRTPSAGDRRRWRLERTPALAVEIPARPPCQEDRTRYHRMPLSTWHQQMEQDRTPTLLACHPQLAWPATGNLPNSCQPHRQHHHHIRTRSAMRVGHRPLSNQTQDHQRTEGSTSHYPARLPWRLELHDQ